MAKAIFDKPFNYTSRTSNAGWSIQPSQTPQHFPRECIEAAIAAGVARKVPVRRTKKPSG